MKSRSKFQSSPLALAILALLSEEPMHPYRMQHLLKERRKHDVVNIRQRASIYQAIDRLHRNEFIEILETRREEGRPDRTIYSITQAGREALMSWMREILSAPKQEFPEFPVALSFIGRLIPDDVLGQLEKRAAALKESLTDMEHEYETIKTVLPRVLLLDHEYKRVVLAAELEWVLSVIEAIRTNELTWSLEWLLEFAAKFKEQQTHE